MWIFGATPEFSEKVFVESLIENTNDSETFGEKI